METDDDAHPPLHEPHVMLVALKVAAHGPARPQDCLETLRATLRSVPDGLPADTRELHRDIVRAYDLLATAALVRPDGTGRFAITPRGQALLETHPKGIDGSVLERYPEYRAYIARISRPHPVSEGVGVDGVVHEPERAYIDGLASYQRGLDLTDNPHEPDTASHLEWENGWSDAHSGASNRTWGPRVPSRPV